MDKKYKIHKERPFNERKDEAEKYIRKHPGFIPIVVERNKKSKLPEVNFKNKYLLPGSFKLIQLNQILRTYIKEIKKEEALYIYANGTALLTANQELETIYHNYKDEDGYLYLEYLEQQSFGGWENKQEKQKNQEQQKISQRQKRNQIDFKQNIQIFKQ
ncbi:hypothetical protein PPERSA_12771 [Pseudocohnilembus persalinus]|uniref:Autophagy-related protein n=1 Tax=Pseudocohnilembus persalinus TaxID=266149 RepID=A0A0V0QT78_PSEPJ|nr:hypothetical protein PPERSA_12771 [Pseudocohnilembus persalinus]|eukprot:KRX05593.1 hypothetical protein PPERSA_12771 [Pseudocohnilembus persalinus]